MAFFGGTFTGISLKVQKEYLERVYEYIKKGLIDGIRLSTRPDCINREIVEQLKKYRVTSIELGVQSLDEKVLKAKVPDIIQLKCSKACETFKGVWNRSRNSADDRITWATIESDYLTALKSLRDATRCS